ncbi:MAG: hypothetical protein ACLPVY_26730 [Acidimicrobiia bacterium]
MSEPGDFDGKDEADDGVALQAAPFHDGVAMLAAALALELAHPETSWEAEHARVADPRRADLQRLVREALRDKENAALVMEGLARHAAIFLIGAATTAGLDPTVMLQTLALGVEVAEARSGDEDEDPSESRSRA